MRLKTTVLALTTFVFLMAGCGEAADENNDQSKQALRCDGDVCTISGTITEDLTIPNDDRQYLLSGPVFVGDKDPSTETVLTVEPGVTVFAEPGTSNNAAFLAVRRGSKIMAEGTKDSPIVFTTSRADGERERGLWGGLIINGRAPINVGETAEGEGNTGTFGGTKPKDSSGVLKYVRVQFAGTLITSENELNGIAFQGVGSGTTIDYVQVHMNADDGVEFFGGTAQAKHLVLTGIGDDSIDWTDGWQGRIQHAVVQQYEGGGDRGIEADNLASDPNKTPRSKPTLANLTIIGASGADAGILLRRGTGAKIYNSIVYNAAAACLDVDTKATFTNGWNSNAGELSGDLTIDRSIIHGCNKAFASDDDFTPPFSVEEWFNKGEKNKQTAPGLRKPGSIESPDYRVKADSAAAKMSGAKPSSWFDQTDYVGAVGPENDWTKGWTIHTTK